VLKTRRRRPLGPDYLLDMGEPVRIRDLAEQMIRFYGYEPGRDIKIDYIGLRHGERVEERLYSPDEVLVPTEYPASTGSSEGPSAHSPCRKRSPDSSPIACLSRAARGITAIGGAQGSLEKVRTYAYRARE